MCNYSLNIKHIYIFRKTNYCEVVACSVNESACNEGWSVIYHSRMENQTVNLIHWFGVNSVWIRQSKTDDNYRWNAAENVSLSKWNFALIVGLHQYLSQSSKMNDCDPECFITTSCAGRRLIICKSVDSADNKAQFQHSYPTIINLNSTTLSSE